MSASNKIPPEEVIAQRQAFLAHYFADKHALLSQIVMKVSSCTPDQVKELVKFICVDEMRNEDEVLKGDFTFDFRRLHVETVFNIWEYLLEIDSHPDIQWEEVVSRYGLHVH